MALSYDLGYAERKRNTPITANPGVVGTIWYEEWERGWKAADSLYGNSGTIPLSKSAPARKNILEAANLYEGTETLCSLVLYGAHILDNPTPEEAKAFWHSIVVCSACPAVAFCPLCRANE